VRIFFERSSDGAWPGITRPGSRRRLSVPVPVDCSYLSGARDRFSYTSVEQRGAHEWVATCSWERDGLQLRMEDIWREDERVVALTRRLVTSGLDPARAIGVRLQLTLLLATSDDDELRFCCPGIVYSPGQHEEPRAYVFADERLSVPLVLGWAEKEGAAVSLARTSLAAYDDAPARVPGQSDYLHRTDIGSVGFVAGPPQPRLLACWPYLEGGRSARLDAAGTRAAAFHPVGPDGLDVTVSYEIRWESASTFADAVRTAFDRSRRVNPPEPARLPFPLGHAVDLRLASLAKTYVEWQPGGAGFLLNFDPDVGYASEARAFGASFTVHGMGGSRGVLEYGFTGRQLNVASLLAERFGGVWVERSGRIHNFFVDAMATPSGWLHTLYSLGKSRPLFSCGDPDGPVMHYLGSSAVPGTYTRMMVEAASDLLRSFQLHSRLGDPHPGWSAACHRFSAFLMGVQEPDGSWYRAYAPDGTPLQSGSWLGDGAKEGKASTAIPIPFLLALAGQLPAQERAPLLQAARAAGEFVLQEHVSRDDYRGGTLDNPNVVDKEAALLAMKAMLCLYDSTGEERWLNAAERAGKLAVTWHVLWDVPSRPSTRLAQAGVRSTGWGGINSTWGTGVTDIYSLFFLDAFVRLSRLTDDPLYEAVADLAAAGCQQMLSHEGERFGFADTGMQPEGIAFCDQGVDDHLIAKGDTWGGLGWIYTAGTYGLNRYLEAKAPGIDHRRPRRP
jgi:hypothetical protein